MPTRKGKHILPRSRRYGKEVAKMALSPFRRGGGGFWDPLSEVNRMFDDMFGGLMRRPGGHRTGTEVTEWAPAVDALQRDGDLIIRAELPGVRPEDVDITLQNRVLTLSGQRWEEHEEQRSGYHVKERRHGSFSRSTTVPEGVDEDSIRARYENGVLELSIKGAAAAREPRRIQIEGSNGAGDSGAPTDVATEGQGATPEWGSRTEEGPSPTARYSRQKKHRWRTGRRAQTASPGPFLLKVKKEVKSIGCEAL
jgi:HSP20 family protein